MKINIQDIINTTINNFDGNYSYDHRLLAYFGYQFNNKNLIEIGTRHGLGALALAQNINNQVTTYDIEIFNRSEMACNRSNINFVIRNVINDSNIQEILNSSFIYLDIDPHTGEQEDIFIKLLEQNHYSGIVLLDDIFDKFTSLYNWFNDLNTTANKYYLHNYSPLLYRWAILDFTKELEIIN